MCRSVFNLWKLPLGSANIVAKKEDRKTEKREKGKDDRMLISSKLTIFNLIFCGPEWTEEKWQSLLNLGLTLKSMNRLITNYETVYS